MKLKVTLLLLLVALPGVVATSWLALPLLVDASTLSVPLQTLQLASALQSTLLVLVAAFVGASAAPRVGVTAPAVFAIAGGGRVIEALRPQIAPGLTGGCIGAAVIVAFHAFAPDALTTVQPATPLPLAVRVLYGGMTEEVLVRWGLMTALAWAGWRIFQQDRQAPSVSVMWTAVVVSALVFGVSHLPAAAQALPAMPAFVAAYITLGNALFGVVAGYLFWRHGLEAAIAAHVCAHLFAFSIRG
jgi:hypothetical protein